MIKLRLTNKGKHIIAVVKLVRMFTELGLKESKELVDNVPSILISYREDISKEQIIKNFAAIGAKVEEIIEEEKPQETEIGSDDAYIANKPGAAKKVQPKTTNWQASSNKSFESKKEIKTKQSKVKQAPHTKLIIKPAIIIAVALAIIKSIFSVVFGFFSVYAVFIVAICIAYYLRKYNPASKKLGLTAALVIFIYYFSLLLTDWIFYMIVYQHLAPFSVFGVFASLFRGYNLLTFIAAGLAFFMAYNKNIFKKLNNKFERPEINIDEIMEN